MTNYQRLARDLRQRKQRHGQPISLGKATELVAAQIVQGFENLDQARDYLAELRHYEIETAGYLLSGDEVKTADLAWAIDYQETDAGMEEAS